METKKHKPLADFIREHRLKEDKNQKEFCQILGVAAIALCRWEKGYSLPPEKYLPKLAEALDVSEEHLRHLRREQKAGCPPETEVNILPLIRQLGKTKIEKVTMDDVEFLVSLQAKLTNPDEPLSLEVIESLLLRNRHQK